MEINLTKELQQKKKNTHTDKQQQKQINFCIWLKSISMTVLNTHTGLHTYLKLNEDAPKSIKTNMISVNTFALISYE